MAEFVILIMEFLSFMLTLVISTILNGVTEAVF